MVKLRKIIDTNRHRGTSRRPVTKRQARARTRQRTRQRASLSSSKRTAKPTSASQSRSRSPKPKSKSIKHSASSSLSGAEKNVLALTVQQLPTKSEERTINSLFSQVPRDEIAEVLSRAPIEYDKPMRKLVQLLGSHDHADAEWSTLCRHSGVAPRDLLHTIIDTYITDASLRVARHMPGVVESMIKAGYDRVTDCPICWSDEHKRSLGYVTVADSNGIMKPVRCTNCVSGRIVLAADKDAVKLAMEAVGFMGNKGPTNAFQFNFGASGGGRSGRGQADQNAPDMADWSRRTDGVFEERMTQEQEQAAQESELAP